MIESVSQKNTKLVRTMLFVVIGMFGFGYALVPLYDVLCDITGLNGKYTDKAVNEASYEIDKSRQLTVEFMTALNEETPMVFRAETKSLNINPGATYTVNFYAENRTDKVMEAQAIPSFSPGSVSEYFKKIECFCFNKQTFKPREKKLMPMRFFVTPDLPENYKKITLAYTFFDLTEKSIK